MATRSLPVRLGRELRLLRDAPPGRRFIRRYNRMVARDRPLWLRIARVLCSGLVAVAGVALLGLPGPGLLVVILGLAMLGGEFAFVARLLDSLELRIRRWLGAAHRSWERAGWVMRAVVLLVALTIVGGAMWGAWEVFFGA